MPGVIQGVNNCQYTAISTVGTITLNTGQAAGLPASPGVFYGVEQLAAGTNFAFTVYDIIPALGLNASITTNTLLNGTGSAGQQFQPGPNGLGIRYRGALVFVTTGTAGAINAYWD